MSGFDAFRAEWNFPDGSEILNILVIDDKSSLERHDYYRRYPYVREVVEADIHDNTVICDAINSFVDRSSEDTSILVLSDDTAAAEDIDSNALTFLIYIQDVIGDRVRRDPQFRRDSIDVVVEILNPKNYDVAHNYNVNNVVISNRYISKMITQIGSKDALYEFYADILTYDEEGAATYWSKELYIKKVSRFFAEIPAPCTAAELIRGVYEASPVDNRSLTIGYVNLDGEMTLFSGDQRSIEVELKEGDKLIVFSNH